MTAMRGHYKNNKQTNKRHTTGTCNSEFNDECSQTWHLQLSLLITFNPVSILGNIMIYQSCITFTSSSCHTFRTVLQSAMSVCELLFGQQLTYGFNPIPSNKHHYSTDNLCYSPFKSTIILLYKYTRKILVLQYGENLTYRSQLWCRSAILPSSSLLYVQFCISSAYIFVQSMRLENNQCYEFHCKIYSNKFQKRFIVLCKNIIMYIQ